MRLSHITASLSAERIFNIMNKTYDYKAYESNCIPVRTVSEDSRDALDVLGSVIGKISSGNILAVIRTVMALVCFFSFIGIIGSVESGSMTVGSGIIISIFLVFIEILCFIPKKQR